MGRTRYESSRGFSLESVEHRLRSLLVMNTVSDVDVEPWEPISGWRSTLTLGALDDGDTALAMTMISR